MQKDALERTHEIAKQEANIRVLEEKSLEQVSTMESLNSTISQLTSEVKELKENLDISELKAKNLEREHRKTEGMHSKMISSLNDEMSELMEENKKLETKILTMQNDR